ASPRLGVHPVFWVLGGPCQFGSWPVWVDSPHPLLFPCSSRPPVAYPFDSTAVELSVVDLGCFVSLKSHPPRCLVHPPSHSMAVHASSLLSSLPPPNSSRPALPAHCLPIRHQPHTRLRSPGFGERHPPHP